MGERKRGAKGVIESSRECERKRTRERGKRRQEKDNDRGNEEEITRKR